MLSISEASIYLQKALDLPDTETAEVIIRAAIARGELAYDARQVTVTGPNEIVITDGITPATAEAVDESSFRVFVEARKLPLTTREVATASDSIDPPSSIDPPYTTPWIEVMRSAILQFFHPRPPRDPKRDEVVSWIKNEAQKRGWDASDNVAQAVFTIIKPEDHNPRKPK